MTPLETSDWQLWDRAGVAETIESYWDGVHETAHRDTLAELCTICLPAGLPPDGDVLDVLEVGCGTGRIYERLVPRLLPNERYTGVDVSARMLALARAKFPRARLVAGDGYGLRFADGAFDAVLAFEVLGHLPEIGPFLGELVRVARRMAIFTVWPAADGVVEGRESVQGASFLQRRFGHDHVLGELREHLPAGAGLDVEVGILHADCWAYVLRRRPAPGVDLTRLFPVPGYQERLLAAVAQR
jgi:SAM-dependent methyltransferase